MSGFGDQVVTRCSGCGYGLTARKYAVPKECPICRTSLDPDVPPPEARAEDAPTEPERADAAQTQLDAVQVHSNGAQAQADDARSESDKDAQADGETDVKSLGETAAQPPSATTLNVPPGAVTSPLGAVTQPVPDADAKESNAEAHAADATPRSEAVEPSPAPRDGFETRRDDDAGRGAGSQFETRAITPPASQRYETSPPTRYETSPPTTVSTPLSTPSTPTPTRTTQPQPTHQPQTTHAPGSLESRVSPEVVGRYTDAYRVARATVFIGNLIKVVGVLLGLLIGVGLFALVAWQGRQFGNTGPLGLFVGLLFGGSAFAFFFVLGTVISAQGQLIKATLDGAVNTSPFLTNDQRAEAMSLR